jgi:hypothetical protein
VSERGEESSKVAERVRGLRQTAKAQLLKV